jgi:hypothetical protein
MSKLLFMWRPSNQTLARVWPIWQTKCPPPAKGIGPVGYGFLAVNPDAFPNDFAADAPEPVARFMAISQVPVSGDALKAKATVAAWKKKAELCSNSHAAPNDQSRSREMHDEAGAIASY